MAVEYRPDSRFWYGRWQRHHRRYSKKLRILVAGEPGSAEFEASRIEAEQALEKLVAEAERNQRPEQLVQSVHELKFGKRIGSIRLGKLSEEWAALPRKRPMSKGRRTFGLTATRRFVEYIQEHHPKVKELAAVTSEMAEAFMAGEEERKVSGRTYNATLSLLRGAFERLRIRAGMLANPFKENLVMKDEESIHRKPFTLDELDHLFQTAEELDPLMYQLITVGACTALRRGDACCLKWADVDLQAGSIRVATRKTGQPVLIPIFSRLRAVLSALPRTGSPYVFPSLADAYKRDSATIGKRLRRVFALAGFGSPAADTEEDSPVIDVPSDEDLRPRVMARLEALGPADVSSKVKESLLQVFDLYSSGVTVPDIARQLAVSKGTVSNHLARIEKAVGHPIVRHDLKKAREHAALAALPERDEGVGEQQARLTRVNDRGFHSLRATFATLALTAGIPVEVLRIITGHSLTETVLRHYFNPHKNTVLKTVEAAMPRLLTNGTASGPTTKEQALALLEGMTAKTFTASRPQLRELILALS